MTEKSTDELLRRIRLLKAKAEGTTNEHEAAAFAAKVAELLAQHGLEEAQLEVADQSGMEHFETKEWNTPQRRILASALCRLYMVRNVMGRRRSDPWILIGRRANIIMVREMSEYLVATTVRLSKQFKKETGCTGKEEIDFRRGCFERLAERVREQYEANKRAAAAQFDARGNPSNLPALIDTERRLAGEYARTVLGFHLRPAPAAGPLKYGSAGAAGRAAGNTVSLSPQIGGRSGAMLIGKR